MRSFLPYLQTETLDYQSNLQKLVLLLRINLDPIKLCAGGSIVETPPDDDVIQCLDWPVKLCQHPVVM